MENISVEKSGFYGVYYPCKTKTIYAFIAMAGDSCDDYLAKSVAKWLNKYKCDVLCMSPAKHDYSHHNFPLERFQKAIAYLKSQGIKKIGIMGASTTGMLALLAASYYNEITLTLAISPSDFVMEGFYQEKGIERPGNNESSVSSKGNPLPYLPYAYRHPEYHIKLKEEAKRGRNMVASREMFDLSEKLHPVREEERIKVENIKGYVILIGAEDDVLWDTCKYIRRMEKIFERCKNANTRCLTYSHGTHFAFPQSMLKTAMPIGSSILPYIAFKAARDFPKECKNTRIDIDKNFNEVLNLWKQ